MKEKKKAESKKPPVIQTTPPSPLTANGNIDQFNSSPVFTGRRASEPAKDKFLDLDDNSKRSSSFSEAPAVQLTPPPPRRQQKPLALVGILS